MIDKPSVAVVKGKSVRKTPLFSLVLQNELVVLSNETFNVWGVDLNGVDFIAVDLSIKMGKCFYSIYMYVRALYVVFISTNNSIIIIHYHPPLP